MSKVTLSRIASLVNAPTSINGILTQIEAAFDKCVFRDGSSPNQMTSSLDMNSNRILNLPDPANLGEPVSLNYLNNHTNTFWLDTYVAGAQTSATNAANSATSSANSATNASVSASAAATSATNSANSATAASISASLAAAVKTGAETARDAAQLSAGIYATTTAGLAATTNGQYFSVPSASSNEYLVLYKNNAGSALQVKTYPSAQAVITPVGRRSGWVDPFFRRFDLTSRIFVNRTRWYGNNSAGNSFGGWTRVASSQFDGYALRRTGGYNNTSYGGPVLFLDEMGAAVGDTITVYALIVGSGDTVYGSHRWLDSTGTEISNGLMVNAAGTNPLVTSATPQWLRISTTVPSGAAQIAIWNYCLSGSAGFDLLSVWGFKGDTSAGPDYPSMEDEYFSAKDTFFESRVTTLEAAGGPFVPIQSVLGDSELVGDATYTFTKVAGGYMAVTSKSVFNTIQTHVWASNDTTNVEWKVWIRSNTTAFNMSTTTPDASGTIAAGSFPIADTLYSLKLPSNLTAQASQYVFYMFRAVDDTAINIKRWLYNASITPARYGFPFSTTAGWNSTFVYGSPTIGFGQTSAKILHYTDEGLVFDGRISTLETTVSGLTPLPKPYFTIPAVVYATVGKELNLYHDAIFSARSDGTSGITGYSVSVVGTKGQNKDRCFRFTPVTGDIGTTSFTAKAWDAAGNLVATRSFSITVVAAAAKGSAKNVLMVGDSLVGAGTIPSTTQADFAALGATVPTFVGSKGTAPANHEGRGGKSFSFFATSGGTSYRFTVSGVGSVGLGATYTTGGVTYTVTEVNITSGSGTILTTGASAPGSSGTLTKASGAGDATITFSASTTESGNPFWNTGTSALDIANYRSVNSISSVIDAVTIQLGINDVFGETVLTNFSGYVNYAKAICDAFLADNASCKIIIELPTICGNTGDGFAANYGATQSRQIFEANIFGLRAALIAAFDAGAYNANVKVGSAGLQVDRYYGYARSTVSVASRITDTVSEHINGVHPTTVGYYQNGDAVFAELMALI